MESFFNYKCCGIGYAELWEKSDSFQEILAPKNVPVLKIKLLGRATCFEEVHIPNNYLFWRKISSETVLKMYLSSRSSWLEKVFVTEKLLCEESSCSRQLSILKKIFLRKSSCFKRLLWFYYNQCVALEI